MAELTDEQIAKEKEFLKGLPRFNLAAFLLPPVWGPAHGFFITILFYPAWLLTDNIIFAAYKNPTFINCILAVSVVLTLLSLSVVFSIVSQPIAAHRAESKGITRKDYLRRQKIWAIVSVVIAILMLALAGWYNLDFRTYEG